MSTIYTNHDVANMTRVGIFEAFELASKSNAWNLQQRARKACDAGKSEETFVAKRNASATPKAPKNDAPIIPLSDKVKLVAQLICLGADREFSALNVKALIEDCEPKETSLLNDSQLDELKAWAGVETQEQRIENYETSLFEATHALAQAIDKRESLIARYNITLDSDSTLVAIFKRLSVIVLTDDEINSLSILAD